VTGKKVTAATVARRRDRQPSRCQPGLSHTAGGSRWVPRRLSPLRGSSGCIVLAAVMRWLDCTGRPK
jgi:hypothetical protein